MRDAVHEAIDCGLIIQKNHGHYRTDVGIVIRGSRFRCYSILCDILSI